MKKKTCVLIAEGNPGELKLFTVAAYEPGLSDLIHLHTAMDREEAIHKLEEAASKGIPYSLLILDLSMPRVSGMDVMRHLLHEFTAARPVIIIRTNSNSPAYLEKNSKALSADMYLQKPMNFRELEYFCRAIRNSIESQGTVSLDSMSIGYRGHLLS